MFDWLMRKKGSVSAGLKRIREQFVEMLQAGHRAFELGSAALLGQVDAEQIRQELFALDKQINRSERQIRKELVVHATVHGAAEFPPCLVMMSIVKDAERIGDYAKNLFDLAKATSLPFEAPEREQLSALRDSVLKLVQRSGQVFQSEQADDAAQLIVDARGVEDACDERILALLRSREGKPTAAAAVLAFRYLKRVASHVRNIASSVVQPVHKLDFTSKIQAPTRSEPEEETG